eukprot:SAG11_NODE_18768_length_481_cov_5.125654_2_plen_50_part_01
MAGPTAIADAASEAEMEPEPEVEVAIDIRIETVKETRKRVDSGDPLEGQ